MIRRGDEHGDRVYPVELLKAFCLERDVIEDARVRVSRGKGRGEVSAGCPDGGSGKARKIKFGHGTTASEYSRRHLA